MASERSDGDAPRAVPPSSGGVPVSAREFAARYAAVAVLDEGPLGKSYRARDKQRDNREVALTVLASRFSRDEALVGRFFQDVRTAQSLVSPRVVEILDVGQIDDGRLFLATELVEGESLRARLAREGALRRHVALEIARQVLLALAAGHAKNLAHGQVTAGHVWLEARVPKSRDNPEGVGARLFGFGLAAMYAAAASPSAAEAEAALPSEEPGPADDVRAVAKLVIGMLRGQTLDGEPGAGDVAGFDAPLRQELERALDRKRGFANATDFSRALGTLLTTGEKHPLPRFAIAGLVMLGIAALAEGFWLLEQRAQTQELEREATVLQAARVLELRKQEAVCAARIEEMEKAIAAREKDIQDLVADIAERKAELERQQAAAASPATSSAPKADPAADFGPELERIRHDLDEAKRERQALVDSLRETQARARELETQNQALVVQSRPEARTAKGFDQLVVLLQSGRGADALVMYEQFARDGTLPQADQRTRDLLAGLARVSAGLEEFGRTRDPDTLRAARERFEEALRGKNGFVAEASAWIDQKLDTEREPARLSALEALAGKLEHDLAAANAQIAGAHESDWQRLAAQTRKSDPAAVLEHARRFGCDHVAGWLQDVADALTREVLRGPHLDVERLCTQAVLDPWSAALSNDPALRAIVGADVVSELAAAKDWYCTTKTAPLRGTSVEVPPLPRDRASEDWRAVLALELELAAPDSFLPIREGAMLVYRDTDLGRGAATWYVDELAGTEGTGDARTWTISRRVYTSGGSVPSSALELSIARRGATFLRAGQVILDLKSHGDGVQATMWSAPNVDALPRKSWFPGAAEFDAFRTELAQRPAACLVVREKSVTRTFSPRYGLVREEEPGLFRLELLYAGPRP